MSTNANELDVQYADDANLRARMETHQRFTVGPDLESAVDANLRLSGDETLLDIGAGPGDFLRRLRTTHYGLLVGADRSMGMVRQARASEPGIHWLQADAQALPVADRAFDVVTARHMLYHVADVPRALHEARRILRPGGIFFVITNASNYMAEFTDAIRQASERATDGAAEVLRERAASPVSASFDDERGAVYLREVFGRVEVTMLQAALRFNDVAPVLRYFDSLRTMRSDVADDWTGARDAFEQVVRERLAGGEWTVSKRVALFTAIA